MEVEQGWTSGQAEFDRRVNGERRIGIGRRIRNRRLETAQITEEQRTAYRRMGSVRREACRRG